jgi:hypothetical protein
MIPTPSRFGSEPFDPQLEQRIRAAVDELRAADAVLAAQLDRYRTRVETETTRMLQLVAQDDVDRARHEQLMRRRRSTVKLLRVAIVTAIALTAAVFALRALRAEAAPPQPTKAEVEHAK